MRRTVLSIVIVAAAFIIGLVFLLRSCLSKYDERSALLPVLYFEKNGEPLIFSIVLYSKATSYSQHGGFTQKTVISNYFIQSNDGNNGTVLKNKKVKNRNDIKNYPVELLGASRDKAWMYMGELLAFDPFTLEKIVDASMLEQKNPALRDKLPAERKYYVFNNADSNIYFTAIDGIKWKLKTNDLSVVPDETDNTRNRLEAEVKRIELLENQNQADQDANYRRSHMASSLSGQGSMSREPYNKAITAYYTVREQLFKQRDSLRQLKNDTRKTEREKKDHLELFARMQRVNLGYYSIKTNADSIKDKWYGLYSDPEMDKLSDRFQYNSENDETARRKLFITGFIKSNTGNLVIAKNDVTAVSMETFLHGGFLLDKKTAAPVRFNNGWLILSKEQIGREGKMIVSAVNYTGKLNWSFNTQLHEWLDWIYAGSHLYVFGNSQNNLSGNECNVLWCINLATGKASRFDYFNSGGN